MNWLVYLCILASSSASLIWVSPAFSEENNSPRSTVISNAANGEDIHGFTMQKRQAPSSYHAFQHVPNGAAVNVFQAVTQNGILEGSTSANFLATSTPDNVSFSGWGLRGYLGTNPLVVSNFGAWFENNEHIVWTQEIDVNNEGRTQPEGSDKGGIGIAVHTGSTYSPDTAITIRRLHGAGTGPGFLRGLVIEGARNVGLRIVAMDKKTYPGLQPAAPGTITALQVARSSDTAARFTLNESGAMTWGGGVAGGDVTLSRSAPSVLTVNGSINDTVSWSDFVPQCRAATGNFVDARAVGRYNRLGQRVFFTINLRIIQNGSGAGAIRCSLPVATNMTLIQTASGREATLKGKALIATLIGETMEIVDYSGGYPGANGAVLALSGSYEAR